MKIAVPVKNNMVDDHFGHSDYFKIFSVENNNVTDTKELKTTQGCGCKSNLVSELTNDGVELVLAGNLGQGAFNKLTNAGIQVIRGCKGDADILLKEYLAGNVKDQIIICHEHKDGECSH